MINQTTSLLDPAEAPSFISTRTGMTEMKEDKEDA